MYQQVCIYGVGAIGGWIGARLGALPGLSLSAVARGHSLTALQTNGLVLHTAQGAQTVPLRASASPADLGVQDLVVLAVKAPALPDVARHIAPLIGPHTVIYTAMNGVPWWFLNGFGGAHAHTPLTSVDPHGEIARALPAGQVLGGVVHASCSTDGPGQIRHHFGHGLIVGEPDGQTSTRAQALQALLAQAGFDCTLSSCIQRDIWFKLWGNMRVNPISAITGATTDRIMGDPLVVDFISGVMQEAKAIGAELGIVIDQSPEDRHAVTRKLGAFTTSMLQDVRAGRAIELDALVTSVHELGALTSVPTPYTSALLGLARLHGRTHGHYPPAQA